MNTQFLSHEDAAVRNRNSVLHYIRRHPYVSRAELFENMNISRASITQVIRILQESGLVAETGEGASTGGRRPTYLAFNGTSKKAYAFNWTTQTLFLMDLSGNILYEKVISFENGVTPSAFSAKINGEIALIDRMNLCPEEDVIGFSLSLPGQIDSRTGTVLYSVALGWQNISLRELFAGRFGANVYLERTGNLIALGAYSRYRAKNCSHFQLYILSDEGIGVSTVIRGSCQHGANYMHGELGHIKVSGSDVPCSCGQRGCLEAVAKALLKESNGNFTEPVISCLSDGISASINIFDADTALLVGSYPEQMSESQREALAAGIRSRVTSQHMRRLNICFDSDVKGLITTGICEHLADRVYPTD